MTKATIAQMYSESQRVVRDRQNSWTIFFLPIIVSSFLAHREELLVCLKGLVNKQFNVVLISLVTWSL